MLRDEAIGTIVNLPGIDIDFIVVAQGHYDVKGDVYPTTLMPAELLDAAELAEVTERLEDSPAVLTTIVPYGPKWHNAEPYELEEKIFLPSHTELGYGDVSFLQQSRLVITEEYESEYHWFPAGEVLPYFDGHVNVPYYFDYYYATRSYMDFAMVTLVTEQITQTFFTSESEFYDAQVYRPDSGIWDNFEFTLDPGLAPGFDEIALGLDVEKRYTFLVNVDDTVIWAVPNILGGIKQSGNYTIHAKPKGINGRATAGNYTVWAVAKGLAGNNWIGGE